MGNSINFNKVGEVITGLTTERIFGFSEQYDWQISIEPEAIAVLNDITEQINKGNLLIGISISDAKKINNVTKQNDSNSERIRILKEIIDICKN